MKYYLLEYKNSNITVFVGAVLQSTTDKRFALKFETQESAEEYLKKELSLWMFKPEVYEFTDDELNNEKR